MSVKVKDVGYGVLADETEAKAVPRKRTVNVQPGGRDGITDRVRH